MQLSDLHRTNPYAGYDFEQYVLDAHGWQSTDPMFRKVIEKVRPELYIEVGTWKGASAFHAIGICKELGLPTKMVCVDTWLGAVEFWTKEYDPTRDLLFINGYPQVYYQFLSNVMYLELEEYIIPFPQTTLIAARWFKKNNVQADVIYIDASHDYDDVLADLRAYWPLVRAGGIMFGDDFHTFADVNRAVETFSREVRTPFVNEGFKWMMVKS